MLKGQAEKQAELEQAELEAEAKRQAKAQSMEDGGGTLIEALQARDGPRGEAIKRAVGATGLSSGPSTRGGGKGC
ncbi:MAG: hypothetical protein SGPRY_008202 [Prymnesium sp.]